MLTDCLLAAVLHMQVYLRIKAAMELAEEARLERDAATSTTTALQQQLEATQVGIGCAGLALAMCPHSSGCVEQNPILRTSLRARGHGVLTLTPLVSQVQFVLKNRCLCCQSQ